VGGLDAIGMGLKRLDIDDPRWAALVAASPGALPYHHPAWAGLLAESYGYEPFVMALEDAGGGIEAGLPVLRVKLPLRGAKWTSLPFTDVCPPVAVSVDARDRFAAALDEAREAGGASRWEVRAELDLAGANASEEGTWHALALEPGADAVFRTFKKTQVQQRIRKAERHGLAVRVADTSDDLTRVFYGLHLATRSRLGTPIQPKRFFRRFWERIVQPGLGSCSIVLADGKPIASAVFLTANGKTTYKYSASDEEHLHLRPNNLLLWDAIKRACEQGQRSFDFGKTEPGNEGLRSFKRAWGTVEHDLSYTTLGGQPTSTAPGEHRTMTAVIRKSPHWVCRAIGETLYKYAG
jgi:CelD/BcsL family acetyltransferase involved in cellulose biosynthesis